MKSRGIFIAAALIASMAVPYPATAQYVYPGSNTLQLLAVMEPATPEALIRTWSGDLSMTRTWSLGASGDFMRVRQDTGNWDVVAAVTAARRLGRNKLAGLTVPYIIRDKEFNESGLLDIRGFVRTAILGGEGGGGLSGEFNFILPTGGEGTPPYPLTLDSAVAGVRLAVFSGPGQWRLGANLGYQYYFSTEAGEDSDLLTGVWLVRKMKHPYSLVVEYSGSTHRHSGLPVDEKVEDNYARVGMIYEISEETNIRLAAGSGLSDSAGDIRVTALATTTWGKAKTAKKRPAKTVSKPEPRPAPAPGTDGITVVIAKGHGRRKVRKRAHKVLELRKYRVVEEKREQFAAPAGTILFFAPGEQEKAIRLSRLLVFGGVLKSAGLKENAAVAAGELVLVLGDK